MSATVQPRPTAPAALLVGWRRAVNLVLDARARVLALTARPRAFVRPVAEVVTPLAWTVLTLGVAAMAAGHAWGWTELVVAAWSSLALLAVSVFFVLGSHQLSARLDLSRDRVVVGEQANGRLVLTNTSRVRTLPLTIEMSVGRGRAAFDLPALAGESEHEELFAIPTSRRAVLDVGPVRAVRSDPLGLLRREQELAGLDLLHVHPRTVRIEGTAAGLVRDLEGQTVRKLSDSDVAFHALRDYVPGDDRRHVHWKSTARAGTMMVRQFDETRRSHMLVVLSTRLDDYASDAEFEAAVSVAGSLGVQTLSEGHTLTAVTSTRTVPGGSPVRFLDQLAGVEYERHAPRLGEVARRVARDHSGASVAVVVCGSLVDATEIRRAGRSMPLDVRTVVLRNHPAAETTVRPMGDLHVATLGDLDDLATAVRRLRQ